MVRVLAPGFALLLVVPLSAQPPDATPVTFPVTRVVLYKSGVAYVEHLGNVEGNQQLAVQFTPAQLDDVLKSLTAIDLGNGRVVGISYDSPTPIDRRLQGLRLPLGQRPTTLDVLTALRGAEVEVRSPSGAVRSGRVLNAERRPRVDDGRTTEVDEVTLVTGQGEIVTLALGPGTAVRVADADLRQELGQYLDIAAAARENDTRRLLISTAGTGARPLLVSYVGESAVWKTTYRLVFRSGGAQPPLLQGWALVDNLSGEDWQNVELSLMAGAPQSFVYPLSRPLFTRRPAVGLPTGLLPTPQLHDPTLVPGEPLAEKVEVRAGRGGGTGGGVVGGVTGGTVGAIAGAAPAAPPPPAAPSRAQFEQALAAGPAATASDLGDLFEYKLTDRVTIRRNESALVPILQAEVGAERVALWNSSMGTRPRRAVWLENSSALTLDAGSISVIDAGAFAGEGLLDTLKPGERRLLSYASDLGVLVAARPGEGTGRTRRLRIVDGALTQESELRDRRVYTIRNQDREARTVVVEHPARSEWTLTGAGKPIESTATVHRFQTAVPPGETGTLIVDEVREGVTRYALTDVTEPQLSILLDAGAGRESLARALKPIFDQREVVARLDSDIAMRKGELEAIVNDQARLRENLGALGDSGGERRLLERYLRQLDEQETRLEELKGQMAWLMGQRLEADRQMSELMRTLTLDLEF